MDAAPSPRLRGRECIGADYPPIFYARRPDRVALDLIGSIVESPRGRCIVVETEAYFGDCDPGSRASKYKGGRIRRRLFGPPGRYLVYGMHGWLLTNIVAHERGRGGAVLLRSCIAEDGNLVEGPGRVSRYLGVALDHDGVIVGANESPRIKCGYQPGSITGLHRVNVRVDFDKPLRYAWVDLFKPRRYVPEKIIGFTPC